MNRSLLLVGLLGASASAAAQGNVTIFGILDAGLVFNTNSGGSRTTSLSSGNMQASRIGFMGAEDLGGGLKAQFRLESGLALDTGALGQGGASFGRQAWVGLANGFGSLTMGRQYDSFVDYVAPGSGATTWGSVYALHPFDYDNISNSYRTNNSVKFRSEVFSGFSFSGVLGLGEQASFGKDRIFSLGAGYAAGDLKLGVAYLKAGDPNFSYYGNNPSSSATASNMAGSTAVAGFASAGNLSLLGLSATYDIGPSRIGTVVTHTRFGNLGVQGGIANPFAAGANAILNSVEINYAYRFASNLTLGVAYNPVRGTPPGGHDGVRYDQFDIGASYALSKRTDVYGAAVYQHAGGYDSRNRPAMANIFNTTASTSDRQAVATLGVRHRF